MTKRLIIAFATVAVLGTGIYAMGNEPNLAASPDSNQTAQAVTAVAPFVTQGDQIKAYNSVGALVEDASIIVEGKVIEATSFEFKPPNTDEILVKTKSKVLVTKSYNDKVKAGDTVTFVESGGVTTKKALGLDKKFNLSQEELDEQVLVSNGTPNMKQDEQVLLYGLAAAPDYQDLLDEPFFFVLGAGQGKFNVEKNEK